MTEFEVATPEAFDRDVLKAEEPTVVMFWAGWCPFCRRFKPVFDAYAAKRDGRFAIVRVDDEDNPLWEKYHVDVVPSIAFFQAGKLVARKDGHLGRGLSEPEFAGFLEQVLPAA